jgi:hypothetical protein
MAGFGGFAGGVEAFERLRAQQQLYEMRQEELQAWRRDQAQKQQDDAQRKRAATDALQLLAPPKPEPGGGPGGAPAMPPGAPSPQPPQQPTPQMGANFGPGGPGAGAQPPAGMMPPGWQQSPASQMQPPGASMSLMGMPSIPKPPTEKDTALAIAPSMLMSVPDFIKKMDAQNIPMEDRPAVLAAYIPLAEAQSKIQAEEFKQVHSAYTAFTDRLKTEREIAHYESERAKAGQPPLTREERNAMAMGAKPGTPDFAQIIADMTINKKASGTGAAPKSYKPEPAYDAQGAFVGTRSVKGDGTVIFRDAEGNEVSKEVAKDWKTATEQKAGKGSAAMAVRTNLVKSGVTNSLARLDEIEKKWGAARTSSFFGQSGDNPVTRSAYGAGKSLFLSSKDRQVDAAWASFIDEAIPVFTGGLRGSDAFRRFLIEQAPGPGDDEKSAREKMRLIRANINGTSKAFFNKFASDPSFWGQGVKPEEVEEAKGGSSGGMSDDALIKKYTK